MKLFNRLAILILRYFGGIGFNRLCIKTLDTGIRKYVGLNEGSIL